MEGTANIPFTDFGGTGDLIHFAHANGYPADGYRQLVNVLKDTHQIKAMHARPLWDDDHRQLRTWKMFADDLIQFLEDHTMKGVIGLGHSMGGIATMVACVERPDLFSHVVLIDPVFLPPSFRWFQMMPYSWQNRFNPMAKVAHKRRNRWASREEVFASWRTKRVFRKIDDDGLRHFVNAAIKPIDNGEVGLAFSREWETRIYCTGVDMWKYWKKLSLPTLVIRADRSNVLLDPIWERMQKSNPKAGFITIENSTHLVPLEKPQEVARHIQDWLNG